jgi:hypothetical protein
MRVLGGCGATGMNLRAILTRVTPMEPEICERGAPWFYQRGIGRGRQLGIFRNSEYRKIKHAKLPFAA